MQQVGPYVDMLLPRRNHLRFLAHSSQFFVRSYTDFEKVLTLMRSNWLVPTATSNPYVRNVLVSSSVEKSLGLTLARACQFDVIETATVRLQLKAFLAAASGARLDRCGGKEGPKRWMTGMTFFMCSFFCVGTPFFT